MYSLFELVAWHITNTNSDECVYWIDKHYPQYNYCCNRHYVSNFSKVKYNNTN